MSSVQRPVVDKLIVDGLCLYSVFQRTVYMYGLWSVIHPLIHLFIYLIISIISSILSPTGPSISQVQHHQLGSVVDREDIYKTSPPTVI